MEWETKIGTAVNFFWDKHILLADQQKVFPYTKTPGGKKKNGQTLLQCARDEVYEETGGVAELRIDPSLSGGGMQFHESHLELVMVIDFYNDIYPLVTPFGKPSFRVYQYVCEYPYFYGKAVDTKEMRNFAWYPFDQLPQGKMIPGDMRFMKYLIQKRVMHGFIRRNCHKDENGNFRFCGEIQSYMYPCTVKDLLAL